MLRGESVVRASAAVQGERLRGADCCCCWLRPLRQPREYREREREREKGRERARLAYAYKTRNTSTTTAGPMSCISSWVFTAAFPRFAGWRLEIQPTSVEFTFSVVPRMIRCSKLLNFIALFCRRAVVYLIRHGETWIMYMITRRWLRRDDWGKKQLGIASWLVDGILLN